MALLDKIAEEVSPSLGSVDWDALEAEMGIPREEIVYATAAPGAPPESAGMFRYQVYLQQAFDRVNASLEGIRLSWQIEDNPATSESEIALAMRAWDQVQEESVSIGDNVLFALRSNIEFLSDEDTLIVDKELLRAMVSSTYMTCLYGLVVHAKALMQLGSVAPEDIISSADSISKTFNAIAQLADMGILDPLRDPTTVPEPPAEPTFSEKLSVQGLGAVPVAVVIAVAAVLGVGLIVWCIVEVTRQQSVNRAIDEMCKEAIRTGGQKDKDRCLELAKLNNAGKEGGPLAAAALSIGQAALMVGVGYALFLLVPPIARMISAKQKASTA